MSSNIIIDRKCHYCNKIFQAKTLFTRYCSKQCNSRDYKKKKREQHLSANLTIEEHSEKGQINLSPISEKEYISISETAIYLGVSKRTVERLIAGNKLPIKRFQRRVLIKRNELNNIL